MEILRILYIHVASEELSGRQNSIVHPFYADSFSALYPLSKADLTPDAPLFGAETVIFPALSAVLNELQDGRKPDYFFDVRTTEEFSCVAPEYSLLSALNLNDVAPLSVKGMGSLSIIQAFALASLYMRSSQCALFCVAESYHRYDEAWNTKSTAKAAGFLLSPTSGDMTLESFGFLKSGQEISKLFQGGNFDCVFLQDAALAPDTFDSPVVPVSCGLTDPFIAFAERPEPFRILTLLKRRNHYGFYIIRKGEASS